MNKKTFEVEIQLACGTLAVDVDWSLSRYPTEDELFDLAYAQVQRDLDSSKLSSWIEL